MYIFCIVAIIYGIYWLLNNLLFNKNIIPFFIRDLFIPNKLE